MSGRASMPAPKKVLDASAKIAVRASGSAFRGAPESQDSASNAIGHAEPKRRGGAGHAHPPVVLPVVTRQTAETLKTLVSERIVCRYT